MFLQKAPKRDYLDADNELIRKTKERPLESYNREKRLLAVKFGKPKVQPPATKKWVAMVEKRQKVRRKLVRCFFTIIY